MTDNISTSNEKSNTLATVLTGLGCGAAGFILVGGFGFALGVAVGIGLFAILAIGLSGTPKPEEWGQIIFIGGFFIGAPLGLITATLCGAGGAALGVIGGLVLRKNRPGKKKVAPDPSTAS